MKNKETLVRISTYARQEKKSVQWVYGLIKAKKIKFKLVDKVKFVVI